MEYCKTSYTVQVQGPKRSDYRREFNGDEKQTHQEREEILKRLREKYVPVSSPQEPSNPLITKPQNTP